MCAQIRFKVDEEKRLEQKKLAEVPLGVPPYAVQMALTSDVFKELVNKLAWTIGSVYRENYSNLKMPARAYALRLAAKIIEDHGYPKQIAK